MFFQPKVNLHTNLDLTSVCAVIVVIDYKINEIEGSYS
jgi:hypothetical protein